jgi:hypothetical protein
MTKNLPWKPQPEMPHPSAMQGPAIPFPPTPRPSYIRGLPLPKTPASDRELKDLFAKSPNTKKAHAKKHPKKNHQDKDIRHTTASDPMKALQVQLINIEYTLTKFNETLAFFDERLRDVEASVGELKETIKDGSGPRTGLETLDLSSLSP